ncbi:MAG: tRNA-binding protein [Flavobacteriaceae bacterium]|nr:tRNA-binding protein [Flavobacteriaceae bacterium]
MSNNISFDDFTKLDLRIGTVTEVSNFPEARKPAYKLKIDFGDLGIKQSSAQITENYSISDLLNRQVVAVVNFERKQIANYFSECLVLGVADKEGAIVLLQSGKPIKNGTSVS